MAYRPLTDIPLSLFGNSSTMLTGGVLRAYVTGTSTPATLYSDADGTSAGTSVTLDARGEPTTIKRIWLDTAVTYKLTLEDADGNVLWTVDPVYGSDVVGGDGSQLTVIATGSAYARTLADRFADVINVSNYADLVSGGDWAAAINAAVSDCPEYGLVQLDGAMTIGSTITIATDNITIQGPAKLTAAASTNFEYMIYGTGRTGVTIQNLEIDANKSNRSGSQNVRFMGAGFVSSTGCGFSNVTVKNTRGFNSVPAVGLALSSTTRGFVDNCDLQDCGDANYTSDGVYTSGTENTISNSRAHTCTDTAFVMENSNYGIISGCSSYDCAAAAAVTAYGSDDYRGNCISGLTARNWDASNTGGIQIGNVSGAANVYDTTLSNVTMYANTGSGYGSGAAVWVRSVGTGIADGVDIVGLNVNGGEHGVVIDDGANVTISSSIIKNVTTTCVSVTNGADHTIKNSHLEDGGYGVITYNAVTVDVIGNTFKGQTVGSLTALNTSVINNVTNTFRSITGLRVTKDAGATVNSIGMINAQPVLSGYQTITTSGAVTGRIEIYDHNAGTVGVIEVKALS